MDTPTCYSCGEVLPDDTDNLCSTCSFELVEDAFPLPAPTDPKD